MTDPTIPSAADPASTPSAGAEAVAWPPAQPRHDQYGSSALGRDQDDAGGSNSTSDQAKAEAGQLKDTAVSQAQDVAGTAKGQAQGVVNEVGQQSRRLLSETTSELTSQVSAQQGRLADSLGGYAGELRSMADNSEQSGVITDLVHQAADRSERAASYLSGREPRDLLDDVKSFAGRRPVAFLGIAVGAGILAGRFSRGLFADAKGGDPALQSGETSERRSVGEHRRAAPSLEEIPTSGAGAGPTYSDPLVDPSRTDQAGFPGTITDPTNPLDGVPVDRDLNR